MDDHPIFVAGLELLLNREVDLEVAGTASNRKEALALIRARAFDLAIMDVGLNNSSDGIEVTKSIKSEQPSLAILILSVRDEVLYAARCIRAGAGGYVMKSEPTESVFSAVRCVLAGEVYLSPVMARRAITNQIRGSAEVGLPLDVLSDRELEVLHLIGHGLSIRKIAGDLGVSIKTIQAHREHIKQKLDLQGAGEVIRYAAHLSGSNDRSSKVG